MINLNNLEASTKQEYREDLVSSLETAAKKLQDLVSQDSYMTQAIEKVLQYDGKTIMVDLGRDITNGNSQKGLTIRIYNGENVSNPNPDKDDARISIDGKYTKYFNYDDQVIEKPIQLQELQEEQIELLNFVKENLIQQLDKLAPSTPEPVATEIPVEVEEITTETADLVQITNPADLLPEGYGTSMNLREGLSELALDVSQMETKLGLMNKKNLTIIAVLNAIFFSEDLYQLTQYVYDLLVN